MPDAKRYPRPLASGLGEIRLLRKTHPKSRYRTVREQIGRMPALRAGQVHPRDRLHSCRSLTSINLKRLKATPQGSSWSDWSDDLRLECHKQSSGKTCAPFLAGCCGTTAIALTTLYALATTSSLF